VSLYVSQTKFHQTNPSDFRNVWKKWNFSFNFESFSTCLWNWIVLDIWSYEVFVLN